MATNASAESTSMVRTGPRIEPGNPEAAIAPVHRSTTPMDPLVCLCEKGGRGAVHLHRLSAPKGTPYVVSIPETTATRRQSSEAGTTLMG